MLSSGAAISSHGLRCLSKASKHCGNVVALTAIHHPFRSQRANSNASNAKQPTDQPESVQVGHLQPRDFHLPAEWARKEGWTVRDSDINLSRAIDPQCWYAASLNNEVISLMCAINYDERFASAGCFITRKDHREKGEGFGAAVLEKALEHTGDRVTQLFAREQLTKKYAKQGFEKDGTCVTQYEREFDDAFWRDFDRRKYAQDGIQLENINQTDLADLAKFDRKYFPASRDIFLRELMRDDKISGLVATRSDNVVGYGTIRDLNEGLWKVGPLYADRPEVAEHIFASLLEKKKPPKLVVAAPISENGNARKLLEGFGMKKQKELFVMYRNGRPEGMEHTGMYAITNNQIG